MKNSTIVCASSKLPAFIRFTVPMAATLMFISPPTMLAANDNRVPEVPDAIRVPDGNKVHFHAYAVGVQTYVWNGTAWVFTGPDAVLFDADGNLVGIHYAYAGPTRPGWESNSGSLVVGAAVATVPSQNPNSVAWLLVQAVSVHGPGVLDRTTYIQRVNTLGGVAPSAPGTAIGEEARMAYTAEYYFYRDESGN